MGDKRKLSEVTIQYGYLEHEAEKHSIWGWISIHVEYQDDHGHRLTETINRAQIEAFKRMHEVIKDLQEVEQLRDELLHLFGSEKLVPSTNP